MTDDLATLRTMRTRALEGGGPERVAAQHARGKLTARERLALLLDDGSFQEMGALATHDEIEFGLADQRYPGDGVVAGFGKINGRRVAVFAQDFTVLGGSFSKVQANKISRIQDLALESGVPLIGLNDSGGARIQEGVGSLAAYGEVFVRNVLASGVIPQISLILGPCAGGAVYSPALTDFVVMVGGTSSMFLTGPDVVEAVTGEQVSIETLGGPDVHDARSGVAHLVAGTEHQALELVKLLLGYLPQNNNEDPPQVAPYDAADRMDEDLNALIPRDEAEAYDVREIIGRVSDRDSFLEIHPAFAPNAVVGFARLDGFSVGMVANQPAVMAGVLDIDSSDKIARFIRICDVYNIPVITFVDCPGFLPGTDQEYRGRDPARRQDHLRVLRGHGAQDLDRDPPRHGWRVRGDELAPDAHRHRVRMARGPDCRDGRRRRRCGCSYRREVRDAEDPAAAEAAYVKELPRGVLQPVPRRGRGPDRRGDRAARDPPAAHPGAGAAADEGPAEPAQEARPVSRVAVMDNLTFGLQTSVLGIGIVFGVLVVLWLLLAAAVRLDARDARAGAERPGATRPAAARPPGTVRLSGVPGDLDPALLAAITVAILRHVETRRLQAAPAMRTYWPGSLLFASRWVAAGRTRQSQSWRRRR